MPHFPFPFKIYIFDLPSWITESKLCHNVNLMPESDRNPRGRLTRNSVFKPDSRYSGSTVNISRWCWRPSWIWHSDAKFQEFLKGPGGYIFKKKGP